MILGCEISCKFAYLDGVKGVWVLYILSQFEKKAENQRPIREHLLKITGNQCVERFLKIFKMRETQPKSPIKKPEYDYQDRSQGVIKPRRSTPSHKCADSAVMSQKLSNTKGAPSRIVKYLFKINHVGPELKSPCRIVDKTNQNSNC